MTVTYTRQVATCRGIGSFWKLLFRWRASIYKLVFYDMVLFLVIYYSISILYRWGLQEHQQGTFEEIVKYFEKQSQQIPLSFVLGFYVSQIMSRWWSQYTSIPWPDGLAVLVSATVNGVDERARLMRRTIMRYVCLSLTIVLTSISPRVKKRFPTSGHLAEAGLLVDNELSIIEKVDSELPVVNKHWVPITWASSLVARARKEGQIKDDHSLNTLLHELNGFRSKCNMLTHYDHMSIPLVYTQVVTIATYTYFLLAAIGRQWIQEKSHSIVDYYFPLVTTLEFFFYMGWLKVAETLINPFGEDDDDFEMNWAIDRNLQVSYMVVDQLHDEHPTLVRDQYWDEVYPSVLPYTVALDKHREHIPESSTANIYISKSDQRQSVINWDRIASYHGLQSDTDDVNSRRRNLINRVGHIFRGNDRCKATTYCGVNDTLPKPESNISRHIGMTNIEMIEEVDEMNKSSTSSEESYSKNKRGHSMINPNESIKLRGQSSNSIDISHEENIEMRGKLI